MRLHLLPLAILAAALGLTACAPKALYFHESTKVAFAADYNTSDSQPLSSSFGYKRRIVAVVPAQERDIPDGGTERNATNSGEALSLVSKFNVRSGTKEGVVITNNFASGMAARTLTRSPGSADSLNVLMHSAPIAVSTTTGETSDGKPATQVVNERLAQIMARRIRPSEMPKSSGTLEYGPDGKLRIKAREIKDNGIKDNGQSDPPPKKASPPPSTGALEYGPDGKLKAKNGEANPPTPKKTAVPKSDGTLEYGPDGKLRLKKSAPSVPALEKADTPAVK